MKLTAIGLSITPNNLTEMYCYKTLASAIMLVLSLACWGQTEEGTHEFSLGIGRNTGKDIFANLSLFSSEEELQSSTVVWPVATLCYHRCIGENITVGGALSRHDLRITDTNTYTHFHESKLLQILTLCFEVQRIYFQRRQFTLYGTLGGGFGGDLSNGKVFFPGLYV
ncbi:MAG: hypothetical protein EBZ77_15355, partial [Chitinophagia bacterium]|nr:hypothetical protein [Chitinophagia bacterium]